MSTAYCSSRITVADFERLANARFAELLDGVVVERPVPNKKHNQLQQRRRDLLKHALGAAWAPVIELSFRPAPEFSLPRADVAVVGRARWDALPDDQHVAGVPELVIEIVSPGNTHCEIEWKRRTALRLGGLQFWTVDPEEQTVAVSTPDGITRHLSLGDVINLEALGARTLSLDDIFADLKSAI